VNQVVENRKKGEGKGKRGVRERMRRLEKQRGRNVRRGKKRERFRGWWKRVRKVEGKGGVRERIKRREKKRKRKMVRVERKGWKGKGREMMERVRVRERERVKVVVRVGTW
jgi:hypothetical protein